MSRLFAGDDPGEDSEPTKLPEPRGREGGDGEAEDAPAEPAHHRQWRGWIAGSAAKRPHLSAEAAQGNEHAEHDESGAGIDAPRGFEEFVHLSCSVTLESGDIKAITDAPGEQVRRHPSIRPATALASEAA